MEGSKLNDDGRRSLNDYVLANSLKSRAVNGHKAASQIEAILTTKVDEATTDGSELSLKQFFSMLANSLFEVLNARP